jgi:hypothetical protein
METMAPGIVHTIIHIDPLKRDDEDDGDDGDDRFPAESGCQICARCGFEAGRDDPIQYVARPDGGFLAPPRLYRQGCGVVTSTGRMVAV